MPYVRKTVYLEKFWTPKKQCIRRVRATWGHVTQGLTVYPFLELSLCELVINYSQRKLNLNLEGTFTYSIRANRTAAFYYFYGFQAAYYGHFWPKIVRKYGIFGRFLVKNDHCVPHGVLIKSGVLFVRIRYIIRAKYIFSAMYFFIGIINWYGQVWDFFLKARTKKWLTAVK